MSLFPHTCFSSLLARPGFSRQFSKASSLNLAASCVFGLLGATRLPKAIFAGHRAVPASSCVFSGLLVLPGFPQLSAEASGLSRLPHMRVSRFSGTAMLPTTVCEGHQTSPCFLTRWLKGLLMLPGCPKKFSEASEHRPDSSYIDIHKHTHTCINTSS